MLNKSLLAVSIAAAFAKQGEWNSFYVCSPLGYDLYLNATYLYNPILGN